MFAGLMLSCLADLESKTDFLRHELTRSVFCLTVLPFLSIIWLQSWDTRCVKVPCQAEARHSQIIGKHPQVKHTEENTIVCSFPIYVHMYTHIVITANKVFSALSPHFSVLGTCLFLLLGLSTSLMGTHNLLHPYYGHEFPTLSH